MKLHISSDFVIDSDFEPYRREGLRIAMLGGPGSGKSWNNSLIAEQFLQQGGTVVIFQPRDEYFTLKEKFDILSVGGVHAKDMEFALTSPGIYAKAVVEDGISMIFYTSAIDDEEKLIPWVSRFISHILKLQEQHKRPLLLILEEGHEYAPRSASGHAAPPWVYNRMIKAFKDCFTQGRKLNIIAIISSQRPQELNFTIRQLANLTFYGKFGDQDISYIDKECLKYVRQRGVKVDASQLLDLGLGEWLVIMGKNTRLIKVTAARVTHHGAETPRLEYVAPRPVGVKKTIDDLSKTIALALAKEEEEGSELEKAKRKIRDLEKKILELEGKANIKMSVKEMIEGNGDEAQQREITRLKEELKRLKSDLSVMKDGAKDSVETIARLKEARNRIEQLEGENKTYSKLKEALAEIMPKASSMSIAAGNETLELQKVVTIIPLQQVKRAIPNISTITVKGKILTAAQAGFFSQWRTMPDLNKELTEKYAWTCSPQQLSQNLADLVDKEILGMRREKDKDLLEYKLSANVTFLEAET